MAKTLLKALLAALAGTAAAELAPTCSGQGPEGCEAADASALLQSSQRRLGLGDELDEKDCGPRTAEDPDTYVDCWNKKEICCVSPSLYASMMAPRQTWDETTTVYPPSRTWAWYGSSDDMVTGLRLRAKFGDEQPSQITVGLEVAVGFNPVSTGFGDPSDPPSAPGFAFLILKQPTGLPVFSPAWSQLFDVFQQAGFTFDYAPVKEILLTYANLDALGWPYDVVQAYKHLTGCKRECAAPGTGEGPTVSRDCGCHEEVVAAWDVLSVYDGDGNTTDCFQAFFDKFPHPTAGQLRVAFQACQDCLPVFTGFGIGYNTLVNPLYCKGAWCCKQSLSSRYAGREFLLPNYPLPVLNASTDGTARYIDLAQVTTSDLNSCGLTNKFC